MPPSVRFRLDESLTPSVAEALKLVGYNIDAGKTGDDDPTIIEWCRLNNAVWIHADDSARRQHGKDLETSGIRTIWLQRPKKGMPAREQLRILACALPKFIDKQKQRKPPRHFRASANDELSNPSFRER